MTPGWTCRRWDDDPLTHVRGSMTRSATVVAWEVSTTCTSESSPKTFGSLPMRHSLVGARRGCQGCNENVVMVNDDWWLCDDYVMARVDNGWKLFVFQWRSRVAKKGPAVQFTTVCCWFDTTERFWIRTLFNVTLRLLSCIQLSTKLWNYCYLIVTWLHDCMYWCWLIEHLNHCSAPKARNHAFSPYEVFDLFSVLSHSHVQWQLCPWLLTLMFSNMKPVCYIFTQLSQLCLLWCCHLHWLLSGRFFGWTCLNRF